MPSTRPTLYLDEDVSVVVATMLRARGFEVVTALDTGHLGRSDSEQLTFEPWPVVSSLHTTESTLSAYIESGWKPGDRTRV